ncbi:hypothetical protein LG634_35535 [Streptomyces bambusae]|uniref:hypothetical protein n=1 Tax=Streptomyces bambusae TaxID=1550616 RepID=UPI001CFFDC59|nr:hypothetical protein [Streptomyces bambusae]MCB5170104.1 hypothetical protein [Streptomyces bambusae]
MRPLNRRSAAAVLLAAALSLTACSSGGGDADEAGKPHAAVPTATSEAVTEPTPPPAKTAPPAAKPTGPVVSDDALKPVTGTFTKEEKKYLSGRVPEKTDPAAVLQSGQEACQRVARTAKRDKDAAVASIIAGEIPAAKAAIPHLCPELKPVLATAETGFTDGVLKNPSAGSYRALTPGPDCTWQAKGSGGKNLEAGPGPGAKPGAKITATVPSGTAEFISTGCYAWIPA